MMAEWLRLILNRLRTSLQLSKEEKRKTFFIFLLLIVFVFGAFLIQKSVVQVNQYVCYQRIVIIQNNSVMAGATPIMDITCFPFSNNQTVTLCFACAYSKKGLYAESTIKPYIIN